MKVFQTSNLMFIQIRGSIYNVKEFANQFVEFFASKKIQNLIVLTSSNASWCIDKFLIEKP
jgi:ABC-type thiamine transport system substrate-binding protein